MMEQLMLIPENIGELIDHAGWMVLAAPEFESPLAPAGDIEVAFAELRGGIDILCSKIGEVGCTELHSMADEARHQLDQNNVKAGSSVLRDIVEYLQGKKWRN
jgi:hypothetical protein